MLDDLNKLATIQEELEKAAVLLSAAKWVVKNPLKALGTTATAGFAAMDAGNAARRASTSIDESKILRGIPPPTQF